MPQPPVEMADIIRAAGAAFFDGGCKWLTWFHVKVLTAILYCRTAVLGGHVDACSRCGYQAISYNSCRNRHCPKCQANARDRWLDARCRDLLPVPYVHVVFTLPHQLAPLALQNKREIYGLLLQVARDPKHLGAEIGFFRTLFTFTSEFCRRVAPDTALAFRGIQENLGVFVRPADDTGIGGRALADFSTLSELERVQLRKIPYT